MISVIIPTWSLTRELREMAEACVRAVRERSASEPEVIVVDNGSPVGPPHVVVDLLIGWQTNRGIAPAWNVGAKYASRDVLVFLNSDCEVLAGWDVPLARCALHGYVAFPETSGAMEIAGWCWAVSRRTFQRVGPFDESFVPAFYEDTDWFQRACDAGVGLRGVPASRVRHTRRTTVFASPWASRAGLLFLSQRFRFAWKHGASPEEPPSFWRRPLALWEGCDGVCLQCGQGRDDHANAGDDRAGARDGAAVGGSGGSEAGHS